MLARYLNLRERSRPDPLVYFLEAVQLPLDRIARIPVEVVDGQAEGEFTDSRLRRDGIKAGSWR